MTSHQWPTQTPLSRDQHLHQLHIYSWQAGWLLAGLAGCAGWQQGDSFGLCWAHSNPTRPILDDSFGPCSAHLGPFNHPARSRLIYPSGQIKAHLTIRLITTHLTVQQITTHLTIWLIITDLIVFLIITHLTVWQIATHWTVQRVRIHYI